MIVSLTGFMGCGKSSTGRILARDLDVPFIDLDEAVEKMEGRSIREIFSSEGEEGFRKAELSALKNVLASAPERGMVVALGGGTIMTEEARELIFQRTECVFLKAGMDRILRNIGSHSESRPLLKDNNPEKLYESRMPVYMTAPYRIGIDKIETVEIVAEIRRLLGI